VKVYDVFFCINDGYIHPLCVALVSILENNADMQFMFHIISQDLSDKSKNKISKLKTRYKNFDFEVTVPDMARFSGLKSTIEHISVETFFRYAIADMYPNMSQALYLDADLVCNGKLNELFNVDLKGFYAAGVRDPNLDSDRYKRLLIGEPMYINTGVLFLNLDAMRRDEMGKKMIALSHELAGRIEYQDQDVINVAFAGKIKEIPIKYNFARGYQFYNESELKYASIIHYTGHRKPWVRRRKLLDFIRKPAVNIWWKYDSINKLIQQKN